MSLTLIIGPMYSSKSSEIIRSIRRYKTINKNILAINHACDTRYDKNCIATHDLVKEECTSVQSLIPLIDSSEYKNADVIFIEEGQFFADLFDFVVQAVETDGKKVMVAGLDGDYKREPFGDILRLVPYADKVKKFSALCKKCGDGTYAHFTKRIVETSGTICVGGVETYEAVCRKHYLE